MDLKWLTVFEIIVLETSKIIITGRLIFIYLLNLNLTVTQT
jgi:hypothetical protein